MPFPIPISIVLSIREKSQLVEYLLNNEHRKKCFTEKFSRMDLVLSL